MMLLNDLKRQLLTLLSQVAIFELIVLKTLVSTYTSMLNKSKE